MHPLAETAELRTVLRKFARFALAEAIVVTALQCLREGLRFRVAFHRIAAIGSRIGVDDIARLK
jgi:hypothetical protein